MALSSSVPSIATTPTAKSGMAGSLLPKQQHAILKKIGFTGPVNTNSMNQFMQSTPGAASLVLKLTKAAKGIKNLNAGGLIRKDYNNKDGFEFSSTFDIDSGTNTDGMNAQAVGTMSDGRKLSKIGDKYKILSADGNSWEGTFDNLEEAAIASGYTKPKFVAESTGGVEGNRTYTYQGRTYTGAEWSNLNSNSQKIEDINTQKDVKTVKQYKLNSSGQVETYAVEEGSEEINDPNTGLPYVKVVENQQAETVNSSAAANTTTTNTATDSGAAASTTTGNENTMAEETREDSAEAKKIKNLNDRLTIAKQNLITEQAKQDNADSIATAQAKVNTLVGELSTLATGKQSETSLLAVADPASLVEKATIAKLDPTTAGTTIDAGTGQLSGEDPKATVSTVDTQAMVDAPAAITAETAAVTTTKGDVDAALKDVTAIQGTVSDEAQVTAEQGELSEGAKAAAVKVDPAKVVEVISGERTVTSDEMAVAQGLDEEAVKANIAEANVPDNIKAAQTSVSPEEIPSAAQIKESDMASAEAITDAGLTEDATATAAKLAKFTVDDQTLVEFKEGKIEAEDTVQGQLASLMQDFDDGTPAWAAGAMRAARAAMASRGLGGSSMAMSAIVQASMESAIPIASADANAFREMKLNNLGRQQQVALSNAAAQQGVEIANFSAEQQTALQNSQNSFSLQSQNLSNKQAVVLANAQIKASLQGQNLSNQQQANIAEAARYAEVSNLNLNNRQQGILQDNANEMQVNLANLSAKQQAYIANAQLEAALQGKKIDNKQQVSITNAARFAEANNLTFTAAEQAKIHNSDLMKTIGLAELNSEQAATLQNAAAIASMDMTNLTNRQQAAVVNAQAFLQMDITNLSNQQQVAIFKGQAIQQSLLTDAAAENAAAQFNASSENQTNQFMATLSSNVSQFNANQSNAIAQYNAGAENAASQFDISIQNQRDIFDASNALVIAQANATWKQNCTTLDTSAQNQINSAFALEVNNMTQKSIDTIWQRERDLMDFAYKGSESAKERGLQLLLGDKKYEEYQKARDDTEDNNMWKTVWDIVLS